MDSCGVCLRAVGKQSLSRILLAAVVVVFVLTECPKNGKYLSGSVLVHDMGLTAQETGSWSRMLGGEKRLEAAYYSLAR